ncbi:hypothetical protein D3C72_2126790 [compost metagenome]
MLGKERLHPARRGDRQAAVVAGAGAGLAGGLDGRSPGRVPRRRGRTAAGSGNFRAVRREGTRRGPVLYSGGFAVRIRTLNDQPH